MPKDNLEQLIKLKQEHPDMPVIHVMHEYFEEGPQVLYLFVREACIVKVWKGDDIKLNDPFEESFVGEEFVGDGGHAQLLDIYEDYYGKQAADEVDKMPYSELIVVQYGSESEEDDEDD